MQHIQGNVARWNDTAGFPIAHQKRKSWIILPAAAAPREPKPGADKRGQRVKWNDSTTHGS